MRIRFLVYQTRMVSGGFVSPSIVTISDISDLLHVSLVFSNESSVSAILATTDFWSVYFLFMPCFGRACFGGLFPLCCYGGLFGVWMNRGLGCDGGGLLSASFSSLCERLQGRWGCRHYDSSLASSVVWCHHRHHSWVQGIAPESRQG